MPFISFIIPVYNAERWLVRCVNSIVSQTFQNIEIILIDDGSIDGSSQLCETFAKENRCVRVVHQSNQGVSAARNIGIELAQGTYVAFVDADDWIDPNVCEIFIESLKRNNYDLFCYSAIYHAKWKTTSFLFKYDIDLLSQKQKEELHRKIMSPVAPDFEHNCNTRFAGSAWGKFYRTEILKKYRLLFSTKTIISEDVLFNVLALDSFEKVGYSRKTFYHYQVNEYSAQNGYRKDSMKYFGFVIDEIQSWINRTKKNQLYQDCANALFVHYLFGALREDLFHKNNPDKDVSWIKLIDILNQKKFQDILNIANVKYFSKVEQLMIMLLKKKKVHLIEFVMIAYNTIFSLDKVCRSIE